MELSAPVSEWIGCFEKLKRAAPPSMVMAVLFKLISSEIVAVDDFIIKISGPRYLISRGNRANKIRELDLVPAMIFGDRDARIRVHPQVVYARLDPRAIAKDLEIVRQNALMELNEVYHNFITRGQLKEGPSEVNYDYFGERQRYRLGRRTLSGIVLPHSKWKIVFFARDHKNFGSIISVINKLKSRCPWVEVAELSDAELSEPGQRDGRTPLCIITVPKMFGSSILMLVDALYQLVDEQEFAALSLPVNTNQSYLFRFVPSRVHQTQGILFGMMASGYEHEDDANNLEANETLKLFLPSPGLIADYGDHLAFADAHPFIQASALGDARVKVKGETTVQITRHLFAGEPPDVPGSNTQTLYYTLQDLLDMEKSYGRVRYTRATFLTNAFMPQFVEEGMADDLIARDFEYATVENIDHSDLIRIYQKVEIAKGLVQSYLINPL